MRDVYTNTMVTCPFHKHGEERKPSCGVNNEPVDGKIWVHCFTCGYKGTLETFISRILGVKDDGTEGINWILQNFDVTYTRKLNVYIGGRQRGKSEETFKQFVEEAAMLHDMSAYLSGSYEDHAHKGAELAKNILDGLGKTTSEETNIICSAIYHHDDKEVVDSPMDEVLKDADVIHHCFNDLSKPIKDKERCRYESLRKEFGLDNY